MDLLKEFLGLISGSTATISLKIALLITFLGGFIWLLMWLDKQKAKLAQENTEKGRSLDQSKIVEENNELFSDAKKSEEKVDDLIQKYKGEKKGGNQT